jgi:hypothetical protein
MKRQPTAARLLNDQTVEVYDQNGNYLYRVNVAPGRAVCAVVGPDSLAVNLTDGRVQVFALAENRSPVLRYTR